jgi:hypothetical protein
LRLPIRTCCTLILHCQFLQCKIRGLDEKHHFAILRTERAEI